VTNAATAPYAEEAKTQYTKGKEQIQAENADIKKALYGEEATLEEDISARDRLANRRDRLAEEDGVTRKDILSL
jgi:hypothetical protein